MKKLKKNQGITLIALVITIVVLLILAGVAISQLTENGLFNKTRETKIKNKKSEYEEEINRIIMEAQIGKYADEYISLSELIERMIISKEWFLSIEKYGENGTVIAKSVTVAAKEEIYPLNIADINNQKIKVVQFIIKTKDNYEIGITINGDSTKLDYVVYGETEMYTITFSYNDGTGNITTQKVRKGKKVILIGQPYERQDYLFTGWKNDLNSENLYLEGVAYPNNEDDGIQSDITLYADWSRNAIKLKLHKNDGTDEIEEISVNTNTQTTIALDKFTRTDYRLLGWTNSLEGTSATIRKWRNSFSC